VVAIIDDTVVTVEIASAARIPDGLVRDEVVVRGQWRIDTTGMQRVMVLRSRLGPTQGRDIGVTWPGEAQVRASSRAVHSVCFHLAVILDKM
jgi:hypothetical protein